MLSKCISSLLFRLLVLAARWLGKPLRRYVSFSREAPFFSLRLVGRSFERVMQGRGTRGCLLAIGGMVLLFAGFTIKLLKVRLLPQGWVSHISHCHFHLSSLI